MPGAVGRGRWELVFSGNRVSVLLSEKSLWMDGGDGSTTM